MLTIICAVVSHLYMAESGILGYCVSLPQDIIFFKQKTAYEISECDWSSDVCSSD
eukprot:COSAG06_NODE_45906_length_351_cov_0.690476_1_plen_54_part_10